MALKVLYEPDDEFLAIRIKDMLEQEGIEVMLRSYQMPWYDGLAKVMRPEWGQVVVDGQDYERAKEILNDLLSSNEQPVELDEFEDSELPEDDSLPIEDTRDG
jgi:hypothetical protein